MCENRLIPSISRSIVTNVPAASAGRLRWPGPNLARRIACTDLWLSSGRDGVCLWPLRMLPRNSRYGFRKFHELDPHRGGAGPFSGRLGTVYPRGMTCSALGRAAGDPPLPGDFSATIALGIGRVVRLGSRRHEPTCRLASRLVWRSRSIALVGLIELGRLCTTGPRAGLLPRWSYPVVAGLALAAVLLAWFGVLEFVLRLAISGRPAGWRPAISARSRTSAVRHCRRNDDSRDRARHACRPRHRRRTAGLSVGRVTVAIAAGGRAGRVASAVVAAWLAFGPMCTIRVGSRSFSGRSAWPVGFVLIAGRRLFCACRGRDEIDDGLLLVESVDAG